jgi:hypothetical protein
MTHAAQHDWHASGIEQRRDAGFMHRTQRIVDNRRSPTGAHSPRVGGYALLRCSARGIGLALALGLVACANDDTKRSLDPVQVAMTGDLEPIFEGEDLTLYEVKRGIQFPMAAPSESDVASLQERAVAPFQRFPFITNEHVEVQVTWTLSNLDAETRNVYILVEPWNEFGRYVPGLQLIDPDDGEFAPNTSGIQILLPLPGTEGGDSSRRHGTFTIEDMNELAIDLATAMNMIANPPGEEARYGVAGLVNHAFAREQRSNRDALSRPYIPGVIPGLTGIDIGLRTFEPANIALEVVVEVIDKDSGKVLEEDSDAEALPEPSVEISVASEGM